MKLFIILATLLASLSSFALEDKFMVLQHRTDDSKSTVAKVRITHEFYQKRDLHIACLHKERRIQFFIVYGQMNAIYNAQTQESADARWSFDFSDLDQVSAQLVDEENIFDMDSNHLYKGGRGGRPDFKEVPEIPISQPSNLQFINDFACIIRKTPSSNN